MVIKYSGQVIASDVQTAYTFWKRFKGLMLTKSMPKNRALHIDPCTSIHMFFMKYPIDILHLNKQNEIVGIEENLMPGKIGKRFKGACSVIELPAGRIARTTAEIGQVVAFIN